MRDDDLARIVRAELVGAARMLRAATALRDLLKGPPDPDALGAGVGGVNALMAEMELCERAKSDLLARRQCGSIAEALQRQGDPDALAAMRRQLDRLAALLAELRAVVAENQELVARGLRYVDYNLNVLAQAQADPGYGPGGDGAQAPPPARKLLDASV